MLVILWEWKYFKSVRNDGNIETVVMQVTTEGGTCSPEKRLDTSTTRNDHSQRTTARELQFYLDLIVPWTKVVCLCVFLFSFLMFGC